MSTFTYDETPSFGLKKEKEDSIWRKTFYLSLVLIAFGEASEHVYGTLQEPMSGKCFYSSHSVAYSYSCKLQ